MKTILSGFFMLLMSQLYAADVTTIVVPSGKTSFQVLLSANPTTGYNWAVTHYDARLLKLVASKYTPEKTGRVGAGGTMTFTFKVVNGATVPASTPLEFRYARPWEKDSGTSKIVTVTFSAR